MNRIDELTKLPSTMEVIKTFQEIKNKKELVIAILDIDNFKKINKKYGKKIGDEVLKYIANILRNKIRKSDFLGRYENDEFYMFFKTDKVEKIIDMFKEINNYLNENPLKTKKGIIKVKVSIGITAHKFKNLEQSLSLAQIALRKVKNTENSILHYQIYECKY